MDAPRRIPIHRSLNRPNLILGGERELVLMTMLFAAMIAFTASSWVQVVIGVVFWLAIHALLVDMAKNDPMMSAVYLRHVRYKGYYPAQTGMQAQIPNARRWKE
ncbi:MAG: conjugal transfer protein TrbD [Pseudomonadota bacterium]|nr:conjugal transfer protein TrbD [Pseudomonadota bacterium]